MRKKICLAPLLCIAILGANCGSGSPSQTVRKYFELIDKGDIDGTLKLLSIKQTTIPADMTAAKGEIVMLIGLLHEQGGLKSVEILKEKVDGNSARVDAKLAVKKGPDENLSYKLAKEPDGWKIEDLLLAPDR